MKKPAAAMPGRLKMDEVGDAEGGANGRSARSRSTASVTVDACTTSHRHSGHAGIHSLKHGKDTSRAGAGTRTQRIGSSMASGARLHSNALKRACMEPPFLCPLDPRSARTHRGPTLAL